MYLLTYCTSLIVLGISVSYTSSSLPTRWEVGQYSQCSSTCGRGVQSRPISCIEIFRNTPAPESLCPSPKPASTRSCSIVACAPDWAAGEWLKCSKTCGRGIQFRDLRCEQRLADGMTSVVSDDYCPKLRPSVKRRCGRVDCPPRYAVKKWTECTSSCGGGLQFRKVHCARIRGGSHTSEVVSTSFCSHLVRPMTKRRCNQNKCIGLPSSFERLDRTDHLGSRSYYRRRRMQRVRPSVGKSARFNEHFSRRRYRFQERRRYGHDTTPSRRISRRRSVAVEKGRVYRCGSNSGEYFNNSRDTEYPCLEPNSFDSLREYRQPTRNFEKQPLHRFRYTLPFIVTHNDVSPVQVAGDIVTYVGGNLMLSDTQMVTILCEASGFPPPATAWYKDGDRLTEDDRHVLLPDHSLRLISPVREDAGNYTCVASNTLGKTSASTALSVATKPKIISTVERSDQFDSETVDAMIGSVIRASPGSLIRISCPVEGFPPPRVRWEKDVAGLGDNVRILPDNSLEIVIASSVDQGLYNCEATNPVGTDYRTSTLLLFETPRLQEFLTSLDLPAGISHGLPRLFLASLRRPLYKIDNRASALLGCLAAGSGYNTIFWSFRGRPIHQFYQEMRFQILVDGKVLFLESVGDDSTGVYSCHVSNEAGNVTGSLEIGLAQYEWIPGEITTCTRTCGGSGIKILPINCVREGTDVVPDLHCDERRKPEALQIPCNRVDCPARFHVGTWGPCSKSCGTGEKWRKVSCLILKSDNSLKLAPSSSCLNIQREGQQPSLNAVDGYSGKPTAVESCFLNTCPRWSTGSWSQCGNKCYDLMMSIRVRRVLCINANGTAVSRMECPQAARPKWRELCYTRRCEPVWAVSKWSSCSRSCGDDGIQTRILSCVFRGNKWQRAGNLCDRDLRPQVSMSCGRQSCSGERSTRPDHRK